MSDHLPENKEMTLWPGLATAVLCALFGANVVAIKISLTGMGVFTAAGIRFGMASVVILLWALATRRPLGIKKVQVGQMVLLSVIFTVQLSLFYLGISRSNASRATLIVNLQPFFVLFLAHFFIPGDRMSLRKILGILLGFAGVAFVFMEKKGTAGDTVTGDLVILSATFIWGINAIYVKRIIHNFRPFHVVFYSMFFSTPVFFLEGVLLDDAMVFGINPKVVTAMLYQILVTASFGFVAWTSLLKKYGAVSMHTFIFIMPISGVLLGGILLKEPITYKIIIALAMIATGILIAHFKQKRQIPLLPLGKNI